jgi:hypothetical protein
MPQSAAWFPLIALIVTVVLVLTVRRKPNDKNDEK